MSLTRFARPQRHSNRISPRISSSTQRTDDDLDISKKSYQPSKDLLEDDIVRARIRERSLIHRYYPSEFKPTYSPDYVHRLTRAAVARAEQSLIRGRVALHMQSPLNAVKTIDTEKILKNLHPERKTQLEIDDNRLEEIAQREYEIFKHRTGKMNKKPFSDDMKRLIRGKSPTTIATALLAEAENNIKAARQEEETFIRQAKRSLQSNLCNRGINKTPYMPLYYVKMLKK